MPPQTRRHRGRVPHLRRAASLSLGVVAIVSLLLLDACTTQPHGSCDSEAGPPQPTFEPVTTPVGANGAVYIGYYATANGSNPTDKAFHYQRNLAAFRISDGRLLWQRPDPVDARVWPMPNGPVNGPTLALAGDNLLLLSNSSTHTLAALRTSDGAPLWQLPRSVSWRAIPVVQDGILYTFDDDGLYAVRLADGQLLWTVAAPTDQHGLPSTRAVLHNPQIFGPVVADGVVYVGWLNGPLMAVRARGRDAAVAGRPYGTGTTADLPA